MRVTNNILFDRISDLSNENRERISTLQQRLASGRRVEKPSDDPFSFVEGKAITEQIEKNKQYQENISDGLYIATRAQQQLENVKDEIFRLKTLATQGANEGVYGQDELDLLAQEVAGIREKIVENLNFDSERYLFAGTATQTRPYEISGTSVIYNGNNEDLTVPISDRFQVEVSASGNNFTQLFSTIEDVQLALEAGDQDAVRAELGDIDAAVQEVTSVEARIGRNIEFMELAEEQLESTNILNQDQRSEAVDADLINTAGRLQQQQTALQAALSANARLIQTSLLNFI